jgi:hypothetical protein
MKYTIISQDDFLEVRARGRVGRQEIENLIGELLAHPDWEPGGKLLVDYSEAMADPITAGEVQSIAKEVTLQRGRFGHARCAHLVARDLEYGMIRMWEAFVDERWDGITMCFRSRGEALAWLKGQ